jgi:ribonuclease BN (tRNA processing enzyme)
MRVTVLGGNAAGPAPGLGCSGYLVQDDKMALVLDLGPGTLLELLKHVDEGAISAVILSHMHQDHWLDIIPFRYRLKYGPMPPGEPIPLHVPPGARGMLDAVARALEPGQATADFYDVFTLSDYDPERELTVGPLQVRFAPSVHSMPCWMIRVVHPDGDLGYTADTGPNPDAPNFLNDVRCLLVEATQLEPESKSHLTARQAGRLAHDSHAREAVLCHVWRELGMDEIIEEARAEYAGPMQIAAPGLTVEW